MTAGLCECFHSCVRAPVCMRASHRNARDVTALPEFRLKVKLSSTDSNKHTWNAFHTLSHGHTASVCPHYPVYDPYSRTLTTFIHKPARFGGKGLRIGVFSPVLTLPETLRWDSLIYITFVFNIFTVFYFHSNH